MKDFISITLEQKALLELYKVSCRQHLTEQNFARCPQTFPPILLTCSHPPPADTPAALQSFQLASRFSLPVCRVVHFCSSHLFLLLMLCLRSTTCVYHLPACFALDLFACLDCLLVPDCKPINFNINLVNFFFFDLLCLHLGPQSFCLVHKSVTQSHILKEITFKEALILYTVSYVHSWKVVVVSILSYFTIILDFVHCWQWHVVCFVVVVVWPVATLFLNWIDCLWNVFALLWVLLLFIVIINYHISSNSSFI